MDTGVSSRCKSYRLKDLTTVQDGIDFARTWLPPVRFQDKITVANVLTGTENSFGTPLLRKYVELIHPYTKIIGPHREADCMASGITFFYGCLMYILHFPNWGQHIENILLYNLLYILVDHCIDDIGIDSSDKQRIIQQMKILVHDPLQYKTMDFADPALKSIALIYHQLITRCPQTKEPIIKLFEAEAEGLQIQSTDTFTRDRYYDIASRKGGYTMEVLYRMVGGTDPDMLAASFHIGTIMQLLDDCVDVYADQSNGIHTIATHDLEATGNLNHLWVDIMNRIRHIDRAFTGFTIIYTFFAVYLPDRNRDCYTKDVWTRTTQLNLFDYTHGCDGSALLVHAVNDELIISDVLGQL